MTNLLKKNILVYYISIILISLTKALPHSILTLILFEKGLTIANIAVVQAMYSLAILLFEIPSGLWADLYSRKQLYILSNIMLLIMCLLIYYSHNYYLICFIWFLYGVSESINSGTIEATIINDIKKEKNSKLHINRFIKLSNQFSLVAVIIGSLLGSYLYFNYGLKFYFLSIILCFLSILIISIFFEEYSTPILKGNASLKQQIKVSIYELKRSRELKLLFILSIVNQVFFQTHFQLWQALFLEKGWNSNKLYILYILFQILAILAYSVPILNFNNGQNHLKFLLIFSIVPPLFLHVSNIYVVLLLYTYSVLVFTVIEYILTNSFANKVTTQNISSLTSMKSSLSRISAILVLVSSSYFLNIYSIQYIVTFNFLLSLILSIGISIFYKIKNT